MIPEPLVISMTTTILQPLHRTTCISQHPQLSILLEQRYTALMSLFTATSTFRLGKDIRVLLNSVICTISTLIFQ